MNSLTDGYKHPRYLAEKAKLYATGPDVRILDVCSGTGNSAKEVAYLCELLKTLASYSVATVERTRKAYEGFGTAPGTA